MPYQKDLQWPSWSFREKKHNLGGDMISWQVYHSEEDQQGHCTLKHLCEVYKLRNTRFWTVKKHSHLGAFKTREKAATAFLEGTFSDETIQLKVKYAFDWRDNPFRNVKHLTKEEARDVWDILESECDAGEKGEDQFVLTMTQPEHPTTEYRFQGALGFGGKFNIDYNRWYVSYYTENETPYLNLCEARANARLHHLYRKQIEEAPNGQK